MYDDAQDHQHRQASITIDRTQSIRTSSGSHAHDFGNGANSSTSHLNHTVYGIRQLAPEYSYRISYVARKSLVSQECGIIIYKHFTPHHGLAVYLIYLWGHSARAREYLG